MGHIASGVLTYLMGHYKYMGDIVSRVLINNAYIRVCRIDDVYDRQTDPYIYLIFSNQ